MHNLRRGGILWLGVLVFSLVIVAASLQLGQSGAQQTASEIPTTLPTFAADPAFSRTTEARPGAATAGLPSSGPARTQMTIADKIPDSIGFDTGFGNSANESPSSDYGFTTTFFYIHNNWYGHTATIRHLRDGSVVHNGYRNQYAVQSDYNFLAYNYGIKLTSGVQTLDNSALVTSELRNFNNLEAIYPQNEYDNVNPHAVILSTTALPAGTTSFVVKGSYPIVGSRVIIGEGTSGPNIAESATVAGYTRGNPPRMILASPTINPHIGLPSGGTRLTLAISASAPYPAVVPPSPPASAPLPLWPPVATPPPSSTSAITVASSSGITPGMWITLDCGSVNAGHNLRTESVQVSPSYSGGSTIPLATNPVYSHDASATVTAGCIRRPPGDVWGALRDISLEETRLQSIFGRTPTLVLLPSLASPVQNSNVFSPLYGGIPLSQMPTTSPVQSHAYFAFTPAGPWGDGLVGGANAHPFCYGMICNGNSFQASLTAAITEGPHHPLWLTETGYFIAAMNGPPTPTAPTYGNPGQIPEDVAVAWYPRKILFELTHGFSRVMLYTIISDQSNSDCLLSLVWSRSGCSGVIATAAPAAGVSITRPKGAYYAVTDLIGLLTDNACKYPGCTFTPDSLTWAWASLPPRNHTHGHCGSYTHAYCGTDPSQVRAYLFEKSDGDVLIAYTYEGQDYQQKQTEAACFSNTTCYSWCGNYSNTTANGNQYACFATKLYVRGAHNWKCTNIQSDTNSTDSTTFGHLVPTSSVVFDSSDTAPLTFYPGIQVLDCTHTGFAPIKVGRPVPSPTPVAAVYAQANPEPIPELPAPTPLPRRFY